MKITKIIIIILIITLFALYVGKTSIIDGKIHIERPVTLICFIVTVIVSQLEDN